MKAAVTGADGLLGKDLVPALRENGDGVLALARRPPDVVRIEEVRESLGRFRPDWVFHLAAFTRVDECESNQRLAHEVNGKGAGNVAEVAADLGAAVVMMSTDYVFDGRSREPYREDDPPAPRSVYGRSKLEGEIQVREANPRHLIVRTSWLYGLHGRCFPEVILRRARSGQPLRVVDDQRGAPTWTRDLARALLRLVASGAVGTFHCTARGECTWHEFAAHIVRRAGLRMQVEAIDSASFGAPAPRPAYSVLSNERFERVTGTRMPAWKPSADEYLDRALTERQAS